MALDTNVLVRFVVQDDASQLATARGLIARYVSRGQALFVPLSVWLELEWVLRSRYRFSKDQVLHALAQLLAARELSFENEAALELALLHYRQGVADFSDCVHAALAAQAGCRPFWTFDEKAARLPGARRLLAEPFA